MSRIAYVNGSYCALSEAGVHIEDRGYQFGDGVYEVVLVQGGKPFDIDGHLARLARSLGEISITPPVSDTVLRMIIRRLVRLNGLKHGIVYLQVTRGVARRDHKFPANARASLVLTTKPLTISADTVGKSAITVPDQRWTRRDIKTIQLLPNCLAKQAAAEQGAYEAIMVMPDGTITEGSSSNVWMVDAKGTLITRPASDDILNGITRLAIKRIGEGRQLKIEERAFSVEEALGAKELFLSSATSIAMPITHLDGQQIADGQPGDIVLALRHAYLNRE